MLSDGAIHFDCVGTSNNSSRGSFKIDVVINGETYMITFHVLDNQIMRHEIFIGADFLNLIELCSVKGEVTIYRIHEKSVVTDNTNLPEVLKIDTIENVDFIDLYSVSDENTHKQVENGKKLLKKRAKSVLK